MNFDFITREVVLTYAGGVCYDSIKYTKIDNQVCRQPRYFQSPPKTNFIMFIPISQSIPLGLLGYSENIFIRSFKRLNKICVHLPSYIVVMLPREYFWHKNK